MRLRLLLALVVTTGFASFPTGAADSALPAGKARVAMGAEERWALRPSEPVKALFASSEDAPRRDVRIVYPPLVEPR